MKAEQCYRQAVMHDEGDSAILNNLGNILRNRGGLTKPSSGFGGRLH